MTHQVLDSSALVAYILDEPGRDIVQQALPEAVISTANLSEVVGKLRERGAPLALVTEMLGDLPVEIIGFDRPLALDAGDLRPSTREWGLSFGDRACLATARNLGVPALTCDQAWKEIEVGVDIRLVR